MEKKTKEKNQKNQSIQEDKINKTKNKKCIFWIKGICNSDYARGMRCSGQKKIAKNCIYHFQKSSSNYSNFSDREKEEIRGVLFPLITLFAFLLSFPFILASIKYAFPNSPQTNLTVQGCNQENNQATKGTFNLACDTTYPNPCGAGTNALSCNDAVVETFTSDGTTTWGGVNATTFNSSITNCLGVTQVFLCYEWWASASTIQNCDVSVDASGGGSYTAINNTCPSTTADNGVVCTNITTSETWGCSNFFGTSGTRAKAKMNGQKSGGGGTRTFTADALFFNVTYNDDPTNPTASFGTNPINTYNSSSQTINFELKCSDNNAVSNLQLWGNWTGSWVVNQTNLTPINDTIWNVSIIGIPEGKKNSFMWGVWCSDSVTNSDWSDTNRTFAVDLTPPQITLPYYTNGTQKQNTQTLTLNISILETMTSPSSCILNINGTNQSVALIGSPNQWTCNTTDGWLTNLPTGNKTIFVWANDSAGWWGTNSSYVVDIISAPITSQCQSNFTILKPLTTINQRPYGRLCYWNDFRGKQILNVTEQPI